MYSSRPPPCFILSFAKRRSRMRLTRKSQQAGGEAQSTAGWDGGHRTLAGSRVRRPGLRGTAVRAGRSIGTNQGGGGGRGREMHTRRSPPPRPRLLGGRGPRASRPGSGGCRDRQQHKSGSAPGVARSQPGHTLPLQGGSERSFRRCRVRRPPGAPGARTGKNPRHTVWRCEARETECRGGNNKGSGCRRREKKKKKKRGPRKWQRRISSQPS